MLSSSKLTKHSTSTKSDKFSTVQKKIDTGATMNDVVLLTNHQVVQKKTEIFKRIAASKLKILLESEPLS